MIYPTPKAVLIMMAGLPVTLLLTMLAPGLWAFGALWIALIVGIMTLDIVLTAPGDRLEVKAHIPTQAYIGDEINIRFDLSCIRAERLSRIHAALSGNECISIPIQYQEIMARDPFVSIVFTGRAKRRGEGKLSALWLRWQGPIGMIWKQKTHNFTTIIPIVSDTQMIRERAIEIFSRDALFGEKLQKDRGDGSEFEAMTEFQMGMDNRYIDWKHSARHGKLLAKEFRTERNHNIIFAFDSGHLMCEPLGNNIDQNNDMTKLDRAINAALLMSYVALKTGDKVGLFGFDKNPYFFSKPIAGTDSYAYLQRLTTQINYSTSETNFTLGLSYLAQTLKRRSLIVIFTDFIDTTNAELMIENITHLLKRHSVIFVAFRDETLEHLIVKRPEVIRDLSQAVIAEGLLRERDLVIARLQRLGVSIIDVPAGRLNIALLNTFLALRAAEKV